MGALWGDPSFLGVGLSFLDGVPSCLAAHGEAHEGLGDHEVLGVHGIVVGVALCEMVEAWDPLGRSLLFPCLEL